MPLLYITLSCLATCHAIFFLHLASIIFSSTFCSLFFSENVGPIYIWLGYSEGVGGDLWFSFTIVSEMATLSKNRFLEIAKVSYFEQDNGLICIIVWQTRLFSRVVLTTKRNRNATNQTKYYATKYTKMRNATKYTKMQNETKIYKIPIRTTWMEREVMKKSKQHFILICMYKKIYEPFFKIQFNV